MYTKLDIAKELLIKERVNVSSNVIINNFIEAKEPVISGNKGRPIRRISNMFNDLIIIYGVICV